MKTHAYLIGIRYDKTNASAETGKRLKVFMGRDCLKDAIERN
jgi:hypothetical protein